jgi:anti-anti-sigma factor
MSDIEQIAQLFRQSVQDHQPRHLVVDFSSVRFFSSQMLGLLVDVWRKLHDCGGAVAVCGINPQLTRVFRITNLDKLFSFYETVEQAINAIRAA